MVYRSSSHLEASRWFDERRSSPCARAWEVVQEVSLLHAWELSCSACHLAGLGTVRVIATPNECCVVLLEVLRRWCTPVSPGRILSPESTGRFAETTKGFLCHLLLQECPLLPQEGPLLPPWPYSMQHRRLSSA